jgi:dimethylhistidine N-methyltransferase
MIKQFLSEVDEGLSQQPKSLPSKYFYDKKGDALFVKIMELPEYYLTRSEMEIFTNKADQIVDGFDLDKNEYFELFELGAGDGSKTRKLLKELSDQGYQYDYMPIDISLNALDQLQQSLAIDLPYVSVKPKHGDYFTILESLKNSHHPKVVLFLGSNIGNMKDKEAAEFIYHLGESLKTNDRILLGVDLKKPVDVILPAYNDSKGITRAFNLNLLYRINEELGGNFDLDAFEHTPKYTEQEGVAKSYLESLQDQHVTISKIGKTYRFAVGEKIHTEISRKYDDEVLDKILENTDFEITAKLTDKKMYFADYILTRS